MSASRQSVTHDHEPPTSAGESHAPSRLQRLLAFERDRRLIERFAGVGLLVVLFAVFSIALPDQFLTRDNLIGVISNQAIATIVALGLILPLACGVFDISVGGMMSLGVVLVTWLFQTTTGAIPVPIAVVAVLIAAAVWGLINAGLAVRLRVDPFIATIGTNTLMLGVAELIANGTTISSNIPSSFTDIAQTSIAGLPITVIYTTILAVLLWYMLDYTPLGRQIYATGQGRDAARLAGVPVGRIITGAFVVSAVFAAIAGILYASNVGSGPPNVGQGYLLPSYTVGFLGATMIKPGRFNVPGLIIATFIVAIGINGLQLLGFELWIVDAFQGGALLAAVIIAQLRTRRA